MPNCEGEVFRDMLDKNSLIQLLAPVAILVIIVLSNEILQGIVALLLLRILQELINIRELVEQNRH